MPVAALLVVGLVLNLIVFRVSNIYIQLDFGVSSNPSGEIPLSQDELKSALGIRRAPNYFALSLESIEESVDEYNSALGTQANEDRKTGRSGQYSFLKVVSFEKRFPSTAVISVIQRTKIARLESYGMGCVIDEDGMMLEKLSEVGPDIHPELILVTGISLKEIPRKCGTVVVPANQKQLETYKCLIHQMLDMSILYVPVRNSESVMLAYSELNIADPQSAILTTWDGYKVIIGLSDEDDIWTIRAKLRTMVYILDEVRGDSSIHSRGTLTVTNVGEAYFSPD